MGVQPQGTGTARVAAIIEEQKSLDGPLLPILHGIQEAFGYIPQEAMPVVAHALNISQAEVYGVATFYHDFRRAPAGRHVLKLCQAEACQSMGSEAVAAKVSEALGIRFHETTPDGAVTLEPVYCLGLCACSPSAMLDGEVIGRVNDETIQDIVRAVRA